MKRKTLQKLKATSFWTLLLVLLLCLPPGRLNAQQPEQYISQNGGGTIIGTSDSRMMASITETETAVSMKVWAIGEMKVDMVNFSVFYDPDVLRLCYPNSSEVSTFGLFLPLNNPAVLEEYLLTKGWVSYSTHKDVGSSFSSTKYSGHETMRAVLVEAGRPGYSPNDLLEVDAGKVKPVFEIFFNKVNQGQALANNNIGIAVKIDPIAYQPKFGYDGLFVWYKDVIVSSDNRKINPNLFLYRSGSSILTGEASENQPTSVQLNGTFSQGTLPVSNTILDTTGTVTSGKGRLNHDVVKKYGFIYSTEDVSISISEFSDIMLIAGVPYPVPTISEINAGSFERGGKHFTIVIVDDNNGVAPTKTYDATIIGLMPHEDYYGWAYMHYLFETSDTYQAVGNRIEFSTKDCIALNIGTVYTLEEPLCKGENGRIQMHVTGGSGKFFFKVNENDYKFYEDNIITGLAAGTYTITVKDTVQVSCPEVTVDNIVLHNAETNLHISMTSSNASDCETQDGTLYVTVTGGEPEYKYKLNNQQVSLTNGMIANQKAGIYVLNVEDKSGCFATTGEVRINSDESLNIVNLAVTQHTTCGNSTGAITFKVTGSTDFTYQLDGFPEKQVTNYVSGSEIEISGLAAGVHYIRVSDNCGEKIEEIIINNGTNGFEFEAIAHHEVMSCDGELVPGSITLNVSNGTPNFQYRIDGGNWVGFPVGLFTTTITGLHNGFYRIEVIDTTNMCMYEVNKVTIERDILMPINVGTYYSAIEPNCGNLTGGAIQMHVTGGSGLYLYEVNGKPFKYYPDGLITGLGAGTYTIVVKDSIHKDCPIVTINNIVLHNANTNLNVTMTADNASTCDMPDGTLYVNVTGGVAPYTYWLDGTQEFLTNGMIPNKKAGVYKLEVKDAALCAAHSGEVHILADNHIIDVSIEVTDHAICGSSTGAIEFTVSNSASYIYQIDGYPVGTGTGTTPVVVSGLSAGLHYLRIYDSCGEKVKEFTVTNGTNALAFEATPVNEALSCNNQLIQGSISLLVHNGMANFKYRVDGGEWKNFAAGKDTVTIAGLHTGVYKVEVIDNNGCTYEVNKITIDREIYTPINVGTYYTAVEPNCNGNNGEIFMSVTGGSGSYLYNVNDEGFTSYPGGLITGLTAGTYTIVVKDAVETNCGEVTISNIVLHNTNTDLNITMTAEKTTNCTSTDGKLFVSVTGGVGTYEYFLNGNDITNAPNFVNGVISGLGVDAYALKVVDATGCVASSGEVRIDSKATDIEVLVAVTQQAICGSSTGAITFKVTKGYSNYTYQIDGHVAGTGTIGTQYVVNGLSAGVHYLLINDGCGEILEKFTITNGIDGLAFEATPTKEVLSCDNVLQPGTISLVVSNGTQNFQYRVDGGAWKNFAAGKDTVTITGLHTGVYKVEVKDATGCYYEVNKVTIEREIHTPIKVGTYFTSVEPTCGNSDGEIQMHVTGGSGLYLYSVNGAQPKYYANGLITGLAAGTYTITVKDSIQTSCSNVTISNIVLHNGDTDLFVAMTSENATNCSLVDGKLHITVTGGTQPYKYWLDGTDVSTEVNNGNGTLTRKAGLYELKVIDANLCEAFSGQVRIHSNSTSMYADIVVTQQAVCGSATGAITFTVSDAASNFTYQIDGYPAGTGTNGTVYVVNGLSAGTHYLRITDNCDEVVQEFFIYNGDINGFAFTAVPSPEMLDCEGELQPGSIAITVKNGTPTYKYRVDGGEWIPFAANTVTIEGLHSGSYLVEVKDTIGCTYEINNVKVARETATGTTNITAPVVTSPQTFCGTATVGNLQATGVDVKWYLTPTGGAPIAKSELLLDTIYYAAQTHGYCESGVRSAVRVIIDDEVILDVPEITSPQNFCGDPDNLKISHIATNGNTNIVWYENDTGGSPLNPDDQLFAQTYYAAIKAGNCQSAPRVKVDITISDEVPGAPDVVTPQYFCDGAMIGNIAVPNNQIRWYSAVSGGIELHADELLIHNETYYAAQIAGDCESTERKAVIVLFEELEAPVADEVQGICGKATLADLVITGAGIVWYETKTGNTVLPLSTELEVGVSYWAAQSSMGSCVGERIEVKITDSCYVVYGTMFPFVYDKNDLVYNKRFKITAKLYAIPENDGKHPILSIISAGALYTDSVKYYDGSVFIPGTPLHPGSIGRADNPGLKINWDDIGLTPGTPDNTSVTKENNEPDGPVGMFKFEHVKQGSYILEIVRPGYITRWGEVMIDVHGMSLGHRELIAGDVNGDLMIDMSDPSLANSKYGGKADANFDPGFDLNGDGNVDFDDIQIIMNNFGASMGTYKETMDWADGY